ncbi:MAG: CTP synthase [Myxococcales bacterium]|nr:MAG: CTP synthase [Myxococcales bacterium]
MVSHEPKYIFVTGGVISSLGKGIASASIGALLQARGLDVSILKLDPYLNVDPGTMNPFQHGEVFVTKDGAETDLDLGHYERYLNKDLGRENSTTAGQIYQEVLEKERNGEYLGATVQVIPHVTDQIKRVIKKAAHGHDILICEVGGTIGDIESLPFIEAIRQFRAEVGAENSVFVHVSYVPLIKSAGELKTKPTQHSVKEALSQGIQPDILLLRSEQAVPDDIKQKISLFCNVPASAVINCTDAQTVYQVPSMLHKEGIDDIIVNLLNIWARKPDLHQWEDVVYRFMNPLSEVCVAVVGKYVDLIESYKSINEALIHAGIAHQSKVRCRFIDAEKLNKDQVAKEFSTVDAILVPGGFGERGIDGKIMAIEYARTHNIPFFGICLGLQMAVIEYARHVAGLKDADSEEFNQHAKTKVIHMMETQLHVQKKGGTMRLGDHPCHIEPNTLAHKIYGKDDIQERHRHRFEVNNHYVDTLKKAGLVVSGTCPSVNLVEIIELKEHDFFIATQFHPEFNSRPSRPHPIFKSFIGAALKKRAGEKDQ